MADGEKYDGQHEYDKCHGKGTHTWPDGSAYSGEWQADETHGQGVHTWPDGCKYQGQWQRGKHHGQGTYTWPDGSTYEGQWERGKQHGHGTTVHTVKSTLSTPLSWNAGDSYQGGHRKGLLHGPVGTWNHADGRVECGEYAKGVRVGNHTTTHPDWHETQQAYSDTGSIAGKEVVTRSAGVLAVDPFTILRALKSSDETKALRRRGSIFASKK
jgi:hypothetical protein